MTPAHAKEITTPMRTPLDGLTKRKERKKSDGRVAHLVAYLSSKVGYVDGSDIDNRRACWTLIQRAEKADPTGDAVQSIERLIDIATDAKNWHSKNATSFRYLLNHAKQIANEHRQRRPSDMSLQERIALAVAANAQYAASFGHAS